MWIFFLKLDSGEVGILKYVSKKNNLIFLPNIFHENMIILRNPLDWIN